MFYTYAMLSLRDRIYVASSNYSRPLMEAKRMRTSDGALEEIDGLLPSGWVLHSIQVTAAGDYSVMMSPQGPIPKTDFLPDGRYPRLFGVGETIREALNDAVEALIDFVTPRGELELSAWPEPNAPSCKRLRERR